MIVFDNVTKVYPGGNTALKNVSLHIRKGEFVFVLGHSGAGKSTFLKLILREEKATSGHVLVDGKDLSRLKEREVPYLRRNMGVVFQDFRLIPSMTAYENVAFAMRVTNIPEKKIVARVPYVFNLVGLSGKMDKYPDELSGGEQQRVSIARAIVNRPPLLVCDEPTGNLDPQTSRGIMDLLERINRTGTTVLVATHDREMVDNMRRRVIALDRGHLTRDQDRGVYGFDV